MPSSACQPLEEFSYGRSEENLDFQIWGYVNVSSVLSRYSTNLSFAVEESEMIYQPIQFDYLHVF